MNGDKLKLDILLASFKSFKFTPIIVLLNRKAGEESISFSNEQN